MDFVLCPLGVQRREIKAKQAIQIIFFGECVGGHGRSEGGMWGG